MRSTAILAFALLAMTGYADDRQEAARREIEDARRRVEEARRHAEAARLKAEAAKREADERAARERTDRAERENDLKFYRRGEDVPLQKSR